MLLAEDAHGEVFNVGAQEEISMLGLADRIREMTRSESEIHVISYEEAYEAVSRTCRGAIRTSRRWTRLL